MVEAINASWKWMQVEAKEVVRTNLFGNIIFNDVQGKFWRLCPEKLSCDLIAVDQEGLDSIIGQEEFQADWEMEDMVEAAKSKLGDLPEGSVYCLKFPPVLGGSYDESNLGTIDHEALIKFSGEMAFQIKDLPDGAKFNIDLEGLVP